MKRLLLYTIFFFLLLIFNQCKGRYLYVPIETEMATDFYVGGYSHYRFDIPLTEQSLAIYSDCYDSCLVTKIYLPEHEEGGCFAVILDQKEDFFHVAIETLNTPLPMNECWIKKGDIAVGTRTTQRLIPLCKKPCVSQIVGVITEPQRVPIFEVKNNWIYTRIRDNRGNWIEGWLSPFYQCPNPFTTCP